MKKVIAILFSLLLAVGIVIGLPMVLKDNKQIQANINNETSLVKQEILSYSTNETVANKLYADGKLIGVVSNMDYLNSLIDIKYKDYENEFPNTSLGLSDNVVIAREKTFVNFENVDDNIMQYLVDNNLLGIKTTAIEFSTNEGVYEIIYVKNIDDFYEARDQFLLNFVSEETIKKLSNRENISSPDELGTVEMNVKMLENISYKDSIVAPDQIIKNTDDIYSFLCYGRNESREYYTVKEGDTLAAVGYYFGNMTAKQVAMLNKDSISSENQIITPGMKLNVTYYTSPITINVTKQVLSQQFITPDVPEYIEDDTLEEGQVKILTQEEVGIKNVLYEEQWTNGVLENGKELSEKLIKQPIRGQIAVGTKVTTMVGTGVYVWPIDNPAITTDYGGYLGHTGTDFVNKYGSYTPVYAIDSGVVDSVGYMSDMGNYIIIDHQNGIRTFYMHLNVPAYYSVGDNISRGQIIGQEGNTGRSYGAHVHLTFEVNGERVDACRYLPCNLIR